MLAVIFVTDDEQATRSAITKRLTRQGHHVVGYESGEALLEGFQYNQETRRHRRSWGKFSPDFGDEPRSQEGSVAWRLSG